MYCTHCGSQAPDEAAFCPNCGRPLARRGQDTAAALGRGQPGIVVLGAQSFPRPEELASMGQRVASFLVDWLLTAIPYLGLIPLVINFCLFRKGSTIGLSLAGARIMRENGDVSGLMHTAVRAVAAYLSLLPLALGYWWAFWDPKRQTWHDKIMHTYVLRDTPALKTRPATSSTGAVVAFWVLLVVFPTLLLLLMVALVFAVYAPFF